MRYLRWNDQIAAYFFTPEMNGRRVYLYLTNEIIEKIGKAENAGLSDFIEAIKRGPDWVSEGGICLRAEQSLVGWRRRKLALPPYIAYLAFFAFAAGYSGDFAPQAYYPRLRMLVGETPTPGTYHGFSNMRQLWDDLENWSQRDRGGQFGIFEAHITSRFIHVGVPISQTILSEDERLALPSIFAEAGLDPTSSPSEAFLAKELLRYGGSSLRPRTIRTLEYCNRLDDEFEALMDAVLQQLADWDGTVIRMVEDRTPKSVSGSVRLWCGELDDVSGTARLRLVCRTRQEFPEDGLTLKLAGDPERYRCEEFRDGWSTPVSFEDGQNFDAALVDWCSGIRLREVEWGWQFNLNTSPVRLFESGAPEGLAGYIEAQRLAPETPFLMIGRHDCSDLIEEWGRQGCVGFKRLGIRNGLPMGWQAYYTDRVLSDELVRDAFPVLSLIPVF